MIAYLDSSVLMRIAFVEPEPLAEWVSIKTGITSALTRLETARALDRERLLATRTDTELQDKEREVSDMLQRLTYVQLDEQVLTQAARHLPVALGTLDAIHLASALLFREAKGPLLFATHDTQLARAARAMDFEVIGA